ncbi:hypothetical protein V1509DRAFT_673295 [Lipomyces kononenkoae]
MTEKDRLARPPSARNTVMSVDLDKILDEFEFNLFSTPTKIVRIEETPIGPPESAKAEPVAPLVVHNKRPDSYYYSDHKDESRRQQVASCAISGEDIISQSATAWPGMQMPWRVIHIPLPTTTTKRKKASKKRRMILKQRAERRQSESVKTTPFKNNDIRNWRFYNNKTPKPKFARRSGDEKVKRAKPYKIAL